jgi:type II secretory pathway component GspD/PulD (secretin)
MKKSIFTLVALGVAALLFSAAGQTTPVSQDDNNTNAAPDQPVSSPEMDNGNGGTPDTGDATPDMGGDQQPDQPATTENSAATSSAILPSQAIGAGNGTVHPSFAPPDAAGTNSDAILLNFVNAPLDEVLSYLSDAAGFIIVLDTQVSGKVSVISKHPMTKDEAVDLLNSVLNQNGYAAIRDGRTLTIMNKTDAMKSDIPVKVSNDPDAIPKNDEIVTQVIPIRFVDAGDLVKDLSSFVSPQATVVANDAGNSIVITDTQSNIRHLAEIIRAIDNSAEAETEIRVFHLKYASPADVATELGSVFPSGTSGNGTQAPTRFAGGFGGGGNPFARFFGGGGGGGGGGGFGGGGGQGGAQNGAGNSSNDRIKKATQVTAVADARIQAVIVTAPKDLMEEIADMMKDLDVPSDRDQDVYVFQMKNGDPQQAVTVLQNMFQSSSTSRGGTSTSQNSALQQRSINNATTSSSTSTSSSGIGGNGAGGNGGGGRQN